MNYHPNQPSSSSRRHGSQSQPPYSSRTGSHRVSYPHANPDHAASSARPQATSSSSRAHPYAATPTHPRSAHSHSHQNLHSSARVSSSQRGNKPTPSTTNASNTTSTRGNTHTNAVAASESDTKFISDSTERIIGLARISPKSDTADLIQRSVRQHIDYQKRLQTHKEHVNSNSKSGGDDSTRKIMDYIEQLTELENREHALSTLSKLRENNPDLAPLLWGTPAVIAALIQEVISVYPYLSGNIEMNSNHSNRCCNALALLQCVASHPETRGLFLKAYIPLFLYPFLNTELNSRPFEYLRLTSLGVIGALVKHPHPNVVPNASSCIIPDCEVTEFLVKTEAIPLCLHIMEYGNELSQTVATFIIQKILLDDYGLNYVCKTSDRFFAISQVLTKMIQDSNKKPSKKLIKHVVRCYLRLCDDKRALLALHSVLPKYLQTSEVDALIGDDESCLSWLQQLRKKYVQSVSAQQEESVRRHHHHHQPQQQQAPTTTQPPHTPQHHHQQHHHHHGAAPPLHAHSLQAHHAHHHPQAPPNLMMNAMSNAFIGNPNVNNATRHRNGSNSYMQR